MLRVPSAVKKSLAAAAVLSIAFVGLMGFAHTKPGRPLLAVIGPVFGMGAAHAGNGRCPFGFDTRQDASEKDAARARFAALHRGTGTPGARIALGFSLDQTTRAEVQAWASAHGIRCTTPRVGADLDCADVPSSLLGERDEPAVKNLWFNFSGKGLLASVIAIRKDPSARSIEAAFQASQQALTAQVGPPSKSLGDPRSGYLAGGLLRQTSVEYSFSGYYAIARAANNGDGFILIEEYRSLPNAVD